MPRYKVLAEGFWEGVTRKPGHPRHGVVHTDKKLKKVPSWLELMPEETKAEKAAREQQDADNAAIAADKAKEDGVAEADVTFIGGEGAGVVETL